MSELWLPIIGFEGRYEVSNLGRVKSLTRIHNSDSKKGHKCYLSHHSKEARQKISKAHKGKPLSEEHKRKLSEAHIRYQRRIKKEEQNENEKFCL